MALKQAIQLRVNKSNIYRYLPNTLNYFSIDPCVINSNRKELRVECSSVLSFLKIYRIYNPTLLPFTYVEPINLENAGNLRSFYQIRGLLDTTLTLSQFQEIKKQDDILCCYIYQHSAFIGIHTRTVRPKLQSSKEKIYLNLNKEKEMRLPKLNQRILFLLVTPKQ